MAYKRVAAAALFAALMAAGSVQAQAPGGCRKKCDASFSSCNKAKKGETVCLRTWHSCKQQCTAAAQAKPMKTAAVPAKLKR